ncbi:MAG: hypothetical protein R3E77_16295 [Steroidobacteraceae bacterium]
MQILIDLLPCLLALAGGLLIGHGLRGFATRKQIAALESEHNNRITAATRDSEEQRTQMRRIEARLGEANRKLQDEDRRRTLLESETTRLRGRLAQLEPLGDEIKARTARLQAAAQEHARLKGELDRAAARLGDLESQLQERATRAEQLEKAAGFLPQRDLRISELEKECNRWRDRSNEQADQIERLGADLDAQRSRADKLQGEHGDYAGELGRLRDALLARDDETRSLRQQVTARDETVDGLRTRVGELDGELQQLVILRRQLQERDTEIGGLRERLGKAEPMREQLAGRDSEIAMLRTRLARHDELQNLLGQRDSEIASLRGEIGRLGELRTSLSEREREAGELQQRCAQYSRDIEDLRRRLADRERAGAQGDEQQARLSAELASLRASASRQEKLAGDLQDCQRRFGELQASARESIDGRDRDIARLRRELDELRSAPPAAAVMQVTPATAPRRVVPPLAPPRTAQPRRDDLKLIHGIGPKIERLLNRNGINTFAQIAAWKAADIKAIEKLLPEFQGRIKRDNWIKGAKLEHRRKYGKDS